MRKLLIAAVLLAGAVPMPKHRHTSLSTEPQSAAPVVPLPAQPQTVAVSLVKLPIPPFANPTITGTPLTVVTQKATSTDSTIPITSVAATASANKLIVPLLANPKLANPTITGTPLTNVDYLKMLGQAGDNASILNLLKTKYGITPLASPTTQPTQLPSFFIALNFMTWDMTVHNADAAKISAADAPIQLIRFYGVVDSAQSLADYITKTPQRKFVLMCSDEVFRPEVARVLNAPNVIAIILGPYQAADTATDDMPIAAQDIELQLQFVRKLSSKPVLLADSVLHWPDMMLPSQFATAFGTHLSDFDGFAIYNLNTFESFDIYKRADLLAKLGLPTNKPAIVLDFLGSTKDNPHNRAMWAARKDGLVMKLKSDGWTGLVVLARGNAKAGGDDDLSFKADVVKGLNVKP